MYLHTEIDHILTCNFTSLLLPCLKPLLTSIYIIKSSLSGSSRMHQCTCCRLTCCNFCNTASEALMCPWSTGAPPCNRDSYSVSTNKQWHSLTLSLVSLPGNLLLCPLNVLQLPCHLSALLGCWRSTSLVWIGFTNINGTESVSFLWQ